MKIFKVYKKIDNELVLTYEADSQNDIWGLNPDDIYQEEQTQQEIAEDQKLEKIAAVKDEIKKLLAETDWTQLKDANLYITDENITEFSVYRDLLREQLDVANNDPWSVVLPEIPEEIKQV